MTMSREGRIVAGITILTIPTIMYGGMTLLGVLTHGVAGLSSGSMALNETQWALFRAGHAHAGVWVALSLVIQVLLDSAVLSPSVKWIARVAAPVAAVAVSGGFFGLAFSSRFTSLLDFGAGCLLVTALLTGIGLLGTQRPARHA
jgi:hypothetical protein